MTRTQLILLGSLLLASPLAAEAQSRLIKVPDVVAQAQRAALEGRPQEALESLQAVVTLAPADADAWLALAWVQKDLGHAAESARCLEKVRQLMPGEADALIKEGAVQHQAQKAETHQELVAKGVIGYKEVGPVSDPVVLPKPNKWTRKWDKAKPVNIEEAAVEDGPPEPTPTPGPPRPKKKPPKLAPLSDLSSGPKISPHP